MYEGEEEASTNNVNRMIISGMRGVLVKMKDMGQNTTILRSLERLKHVVEVAYRGKAGVLWEML
jgi:hypothetical protein